MAGTLDRRMPTRTRIAPTAKLIDGLIDAKRHEPRLLSPATGSPAPTRTHPVFALQQTIGNRAVRALLRQPQEPTSADVLSKWKTHWWDYETKKEDCRAATRRIAKLMGGTDINLKDLKGRYMPLYRLKPDEERATKQEVKDAYNRGRHYPDEVITGWPFDSFKAYSGRRDNLSYRVYPLLAGMCIYTAEGAYPAVKSRLPSKWSQRHMMMYAGDGVVYENFRDPKVKLERRNLTKPNPTDWYAPYAHANASFFVGLSIYDPFSDLRSWGVSRFIEATLLLGGD